MNDITVGNCSRPTPVTEGKMKKELPKILAVVGLLTLAVVAIWMNRYQYQQAGTRLVRIDRFTGQGCYFQGDGTWDSRAVPSPPKPDESSSFFKGLGGKDKDSDKQKYESPFEEGNKCK
jgi:hypothetical protein